jgi:carboxymethylenebutenolidase
MGNRIVRALVFLGLLGGCALPAPTPSAPPAPPIAPAADSPASSPRGFEIEGRWVELESFPANGGWPAPAVVILHGASGVGDGHRLHELAERLSAAGIAAYIPHYFDGLAPGLRATASSPRLHRQREAVIAAALAYVAAQPNVDAARIGLFGVSLGGFHAVALAAREPGYGAVVDLVGAMPRGIDRAAIRRMPPTLILHGERDALVPVSRARELARLLKRVGATHEIKIYSGQGHVLRGPAWTDSLARSIEFFRRHLGPAAYARHND